MSKIAGLFLIAAGVGTAAYVYPLMGSGDERSDVRLADPVSITASSSSLRPPAVIVRPAGQDTQRVISAEITPGKLPLATQPVRAPAMAVVVPAPEASSGAKPIEVPLPSAARRQGKAEDEAKTALTRDIQRELIRVGCFDGVADGTWTPETRQAMKQFIDRVNASLPVDEADHILKTLIQGHPGNACGRSCPAGQTNSRDGKCVPTAIIAVPKRLPQNANGSREASAPSAKSSSWEPKVVLAPQPVQRPQVAALPEPRAAEMKVDRVEPLPGRTSLGATGVPAPVATSPVTDASGDPREKRAAIVVRPRAPAPGTNPDNGATAALPTAPSVSAPGAPSIGAVAAIEAPDAPNARPAPVPGAPFPPVAFRPSTQRSANTYNGPNYQPRQRFGPHIFRELERNGGR